MTASSIPAIPDTDPALLAEHASASGEALRSVDELGADAGAVFRFHGRRRLIESLGNLFLDDRPTLLAPRRRHLHLVLERRIGGCSAAFRHVDGRLEMVRRGHLADIVGAETPYVLNAFAESHDPNEKETNPGLIRLTTSGFDTNESLFQPPEGERCGELLDACVRIANVAPAPPIVRAAWLCAAVLAVHPFVDGNGRTARLLFQLVASSGDGGRTDWGTVEQWAIDRTGYVEALKLSQAPSVPSYDGELVDTGVFIDFALRASIAGARMTRRRAGWFGAAWELLDDRDPALCTAEIAVVASRSHSLDELSTLNNLSDPIVCTEVVEALVRDGRLVWDRRGLLRAGARSPLLELGG